MKNVKVKTDLPPNFMLTHLYRFDWFNHNWQLDVDKTPHFIKHGYVWRFNGIPKDERTKAMKWVWDNVGANYV